MILLPSLQRRYMIYICSLSPKCILLGKEIVMHCLVSMYRLTASLSSFSLSSSISLQHSSIVILKLNAQPPPFQILPTAANFIKTLSTPVAIPTHNHKCYIFDIFFLIKPCVFEVEQPSDYASLLLQVR